MKRFAVIIMLAVIPLCVCAQKGLAINKVFEGQIIPQERIVETRIRGKMIAKYQLNFYRSVRSKVSAAEARTITDLVLTDKKQSVSAIDTNAPTGSKQVHTLKMELPPDGSTHRYLCCQDRWTKKEEHEMTLIYMEGTVSSLEKLNELLNKE